MTLSPKLFLGWKKFQIKFEGTIQDTHFMSNIYIYIRFKDMPYKRQLQEIRQSNLGQRDTDLCADIMGVTDRSNCILLVLLRHVFCCYEYFLHGN